MDCRGTLGLENKKTRSVYDKRGTGEVRGGTYLVPFNTEPAACRCHVVVSRMVGVEF